MQKRYLEAKNYPMWLDEDCMILTVMDSRNKNFYAFHKNIADGSIYKTMELVILFKNRQQYRYNCGTPWLECR